MANWGDAVAAGAKRLGLNSKDFGLIRSQGVDRHFVVEAKVFDGQRRTASYVVSGFNQAYRYLLDFDEPFGCLLIYNISERDLRFDVGSSFGTVPAVVHNNKTVYLLCVDVADHSQPASRRGKVEGTTITQAQLVGSLPQA